MKIQIHPIHKPLLKMQNNWDAEQLQDNAEEIDNKDVPDKPKFAMQ